MSETVALTIEDVGLRLVDLVEELRAVGQVSFGLERVLTVCGDGDGECCHIVEIVDPAAEGLFDDWSPRDVPAGGGSNFSIDYRSPELAVVVVRRLASRHRVIVDTNYGSIVPAEGLTVEMLRPELS